MEQHKQGTPWWGIVSIVLLALGWAFAKYNLYLYDRGGSVQFSSWAF